MRIALYAPMKPPTHPVPSGDRAMARLIVAALSRMGHEVTLASTLRSYDGRGDRMRQHRLARRGAAEAERLVGTWAEDRPDLWFTYHLYHKAPDHLGPRVAETFELPYVVAEASVARKRRRGPWAAGFALSLAALARADALMPVTVEDAQGLAEAGIPRRRMVALPPFLDTAPYDRARRGTKRRELARHGLDPAKTWAVAVAMMRPGDKMASYRVLAEAVRRLDVSRMELLVAGEGAGRAEVETLFAGRAVLLGRIPPRSLPALLAACDLCLWPAVNEAYGMALLAAQAAGLPVVAGRARGVPEIVIDGETGLLALEGDAEAFAEAAAELIADDERRAAMARAAWRHVRLRHGMEAACRALDEALTVARRAR